MYIIPYVLEDSIESKSDFTLQKIWLFLSHGGKQLWKIQDKISKETIIKEYLEENGFYGNVTYSDSEYIYYKVNTNKTQMSDFWFLFDEGANDSMDLWRQFYWIPGEEWGWEENPPFAPILKKITNF
jgi:hypothetical protein